MCEFVLINQNCRVMDTFMGTAILCIARLHSLSIVVINSVASLYEYVQFCCRGATGAGYLRPSDRFRNKAGEYFALKSSLHPLSYPGSKWTKRETKKYTLIKLKIQNGCTKCVAACPRQFSHGMYNVLCT